MHLHPATPWSYGLVGFHRKPMKYELEKFVHQVEEDEREREGKHLRIYLDLVKAKVHKGGGFLFLDSPGDTGKTFPRKLHLCQSQVARSPRVSLHHLKLCLTFKKVVRLHVQLSRCHHIWLKFKALNISKRTGKAELFKSLNIIEQGNICCLKWLWTISTCFAKRPSTSCFQFLQKVHISEVKCKQLELTTNRVWFLWEITKMKLTLQ